MAQVMLQCSYHYTATWKSG